MEDSNRGSASSRFTTTNKDPALGAHTVVFLLVFLSSCLADWFAKRHPDGSEDETTKLTLSFVALDVLQNFFYCAGFLVVAVTYRLIAMRIWIIYHRLQEEHQGNDDLELDQLLDSLSDAVSSYESSFRVAEESAPGLPWQSHCCFCSSPCKWPRL